MATLRKYLKEKTSDAVTVPQIVEESGQSYQTLNNWVQSGKPDKALLIDLLIDGIKYRKLLKDIK